MEEKRMEHERSMLEIRMKMEYEHGPAGRGFDVTKYTKMLSSFSEDQVDDFFSHFEKIALAEKWPKDSWVALVQTRFIGKARETYISLSPEDSTCYDLVKAAVLKAYELVPEAYRNMFRKHQKEDR